MIPALALAIILGCAIPLRRIWRNRQAGYDIENWLQ
jgi:uncharacterized membrane protein YhiD involved in acid resistance